MASPARAMVMKMRSSVSVAPAAVWVSGVPGFCAMSAGLSEGHMKARSIRSCAPGRRCTGMRMAAGGTSNATPAIVIGSSGASSATGTPGQRGHST